jgi:hypothetical protein
LTIIVSAISESKDEMPTQIAKEGAITMEKRIDELIKAGWEVIDSDFDPHAFQHWRLKAFECLAAMFGPDHIYTKYFEQFVEQGDRANVLAAGGVLVAAKQQLDGPELQPSKAFAQLTERDYNAVK